MSFMLHVNGLGYLHQVIERENDFIASIHLIQKEEEKEKKEEQEKASEGRKAQDQSDVCWVECLLPKKYVKSFQLLGEAVQLERSVILAFKSAYQDISICDCCTPEDPRRIIKIQSCLEEVEYLFVDGIEQSLRQWQVS